MGDGGGQSVWVTLPPITAAAITCAILMYPVDVLRALRMGSAADAKQGIGQIVRNFLRVYGFRGLLKQGVGPEVLRATAMRCSKFFFYPITHRAMFAKEPSAGSGASKAFAGAFATIPESIAIMPVEISKIGLQLDKENKFKNSGVGALRHIWTTQGVPGIFCGYFGIQYRQAAWTGAYFGSLAFFQQQVDSAIAATVGGKNVFVSQLISGFFAGVFGSVFNTPGDVIRSVIQKRAFSQTTRSRITPALLWSGVTEFFKVGAEIVGTKSFAGLYYGFGFKAIHLGGSGALLAWLVPLFKSMMAVTKE